MRPKFSLTLPLALSVSAFALTAQAKVPMVLTDIPAVASLTAQVMGDLGDPQALLGPGADEHHYQLRPTQARALQDSDLLIWIGPELTPWLVPAAQSKDGDHLLGLLASEGTILRSYADEHEDHDDHGHDDHAHDDHEGHAHDDHANDDHAHEGHDDHGHSHEGTDPHAWLDPENAVTWLGTIAERLAALDPENAATYRANAEAAQADLTALTAELEAEIAPVKDLPFVTGHDAYGYLQARFSLNILGSVLLGDATSGGAGHPRELLAAMKDQGAVCIFPESQLDAKPALLLAEGTGVRVGAPIDPSGSTLEAGAGLYAAMMRDLIGAISTCLKG
jgi:zinc transport system substrate-binding protein